MLFNSFTYMLFLPAVVALYWLAPRVLRPSLLLMASYFFYMNWIPAYGLLILTLTVVNYFTGLAIYRFGNHRKFWLTLGLIFNLGCLCYFKYANFVVGSLWRLAVWAQQLKVVGSLVQAISSLPSFTLPTLPLPAAEPTLNILLPLGISFFTFEFIHYIVDVYRGSVPIGNFLHFALFGAFFPSQIAGPIKRFQDFMKQLIHQPVFDNAVFANGVALIFLGLFKKMVLADNIAPIVNTGFAHPESLGTLDAWLVTAGFTLQIFFDFSGYTDIGRGSALLFGYRVPENFNWPFLASSLTDFWRRWHMSLSTWLRDYLFIPLGGSRVGSWRLRFNLLVTMLLGGLWHGAAWHFVIWGAFHGVGLVTCRTWQDFVAGVPALTRLKPHPLWHWSGWFTTMIFLIFAGLFFRANDIPQVIQMMSRMLSVHPCGPVIDTLLTSTVPSVLLAYVVYLLIAALIRTISQVAVVHGGVAHEPSLSSSYAALSISATLSNSAARLVAAVLAATNKTIAWWRGSMPAHAAAYVALALVIMGFAPGKVAPFIYFQF